MNMDGIMGWCSLGGIVGGAIGTLAGFAIGVQKDHEEQQYAMENAVAAAEAMGDLDLGDDIEQEETDE